MGLEPTTIDTVSLKGSACNGGYCLPSRLEVWRATIAPLRQTLRRTKMQSTRMWRQVKLKLAGKKYEIKFSGHVWCLCFRYVGHLPSPNVKLSRSCLNIYNFISLFLGDFYRSQALNVDLFVRSHCPSMSWNVFSANAYLLKANSSGQMCHHDCVCHYAVGDFDLTATTAVL